MNKFVKQRSVQLVRKPTLRISRSEIEPKEVQSPLSVSLPASILNLQIQSNPRDVKGTAQ